RARRRGSDSHRGGDSRSGGQVRGRAHAGGARPRRRTGRMEQEPLNEQSPSTEMVSARIPIVIGSGVVVLLVLGAVLFFRARAETNHVALSSVPKGVTTVKAEASTFRSSRRYVATVEPWLSANVGPQLVAAYVDTVLVRPGAQVKHGEVLATLDCRSAAA